MMLARSLAAAVLCVAFTSAGSALAAPVVYDGFDGSPVGFTSYTFSPGDGAINSGGLTYPSLQTAPGYYAGNQFNGTQAVLASPVNNATAHDGTYATNGVVWASWLYRTDTVGNPWSRLVQKTGTGYGDEGLNLGHMNNGFEGWWIRGGFLGQSDVGLADDLPAATTYLVVAKYDFGTSASNSDGSLTLYINPSEASLGTAAPVTSGTVTESFTNDALLNFTGLEFRADGPSTAFDELRVGSTFASVTPSTAAVPEPTTALVFAAVGALAMHRRRLRRR